MELPEMLSRGGNSGKSEITVKMIHSYSISWGGESAGTNNHRYVVTSLDVDGADLDSFTVNNFLPRITNYTHSDNGASGTINLRITGFVYDRASRTITCSVYYQHAYAQSTNRADIQIYAIW